MIEEKNLLHSGSYREYIKNSGETLPNIIVIFNGFDLFIELFDKAIDSLIALTRDCARYGIYFILTGLSTSSIRIKLLRNFTNFVSLQMNEPSDYRNIFNVSTTIEPSKLFGRGIVKRDELVEFQTAYAVKSDKLYDTIKDFCLNFSHQTDKKSNSIPVLPDVVNIEDVYKDKVSINYIPVGISKFTLEITNLNLKEEIGYCVSSRNFKTLINFMNSFLLILDKSNLNTFVFDSKFMYEENKFSNVKYMTTNFSDVLNKISNYVDQVSDVLIKNNYVKSSIKDIQDIVCILVGPEKFVKGLNSDDKKLFDNIVLKTKDILKVHFIYIDSYGSLRKCEYEQWYKDTVNSSNGLWIGNGFSEQQSIKPLKMQQAYYAVIEDNYAYLVNDGIVDFIKIVGSLDKDN